jgi:hypothetical protein
VKPFVTEDGDVYYQIDPTTCQASASADETIVPASEIIHDRGLTPYHPLCGVSPIFACATSSSAGQPHSIAGDAIFRECGPPVRNADGARAKSTTARPKRVSSRQTEAATTGANIGRLLVAGNGLKYEPFSMMSACRFPARRTAELDGISTSRARSWFRRRSSASPTGTSGKADEQSDMAYYKQTLQCDIEEIELLLDEGLGLGPVPGNAYGTELDIEGFIAHGPEVAGRSAGDRHASQDASRPQRRAVVKKTLPPVEGGESPMIQQQNYSLARPSPNATQRKIRSRAPHEGC